MDTYNSKSRVRTTKISKSKDIDQRISLQKTVTIEYEDDRIFHNKNREEERRNRVKLKLPVLTPKKS